LHAKYREDLSTHLEYDLELWLEDRATGGLDRNQVYYISMTIAWDMRPGCNVLTIGTPQSNLRKPSPIVKELFEEWSGALRVENELKHEGKSRNQW